ncbi:Clr5 domain-containing protein [Mariannaea sp. PMI_226]|nr:Clr5 domain-containing protein [Mariannaea sp. PMI_226]
MMAKPWNEHRSTITRLYIQDGRKLEDVRTIMKTKYGFDASTRSYRQHFDHWNVTKYNCKKRQRRRQASSGAALPSPPQTPIVGLSAPMRLTRHRGDIIVRPVRLPSPDSLSTRSNIRGFHSPEQQLPLPDISSVSLQHRMVNSSRVPPYFQGHSMFVRHKNIPSVHHPFVEENMQAMLRNPNMTESMLPPMTIDHANIKSETKYMSRTGYPTDTANWNVSRPSLATPFLGSGVEASYGFYPGTHIESFSGSSTARSTCTTDNVPAMQSSPPTVSRLLSGKELGQPDRSKDLHEQHMTNSTFQESSCVQLKLQIPQDLQTR